MICDRPQSVSGFRALQMKRKAGAEQDIASHGTWRRWCAGGEPS